MHVINSIFPTELHLASDTDNPTFFNTLKAYFGAKGNKARRFTIIRDSRLSHPANATRHQHDALSVLSLVSKIDTVTFLVEPMFADRYSAIEWDRDGFAKATTDAEIAAWAQRLHKMQTEEFLRPRVVQAPDGSWHQS